MRGLLRLLCAAAALAAQAAWCAEADIAPTSCNEFLAAEQQRHAGAFHDALVITDEVFSSAEDCRLLRDFYFQTRAASGRQLDPRALADIVANTWQVQPEDHSGKWTTAFLDWLKQIGFEEFSRSIAEFVESRFPEAATLDAFFTLLLWIIVVATLVLVLREFYLAGLLRLPGRRSRKPPEIPEPVHELPRWRDILALPLREQMAALLRYSIAVLVTRGKLPATPGLTNREYLAHLAGGGSGEAGLLRSQVELTEPVIYGDARVREEHLRACRHASEQLAVLAGEADPRA